MGGHGVEPVFRVADAVKARLVASAAKNIVLMLTAFSTAILHATVDERNGHFRSILSVLLGA